MKKFIFLQKQNVIKCYALLAQLVEHAAVNRKVIGSIPIQSEIKYICILFQYSINDR